MTLNIIVTSSSLTSKGQIYEARLDGEVLCRSLTPFLSAARVLLDARHSPDTVVTMRHEGSPVVSLRSTLGRAAKLTVIDNRHEGPRFAKYRPLPPIEKAHGAVRGGSETATIRQPLTMTL